jgi:twinkle protein
VSRFIPDDIDFSAYEHETEFKAQVRKPSAFADDLAGEFMPHGSRVRRGVMHSTKLRSAIEFRPGEVTVWAGFNGHRKSMFTGQVALDLVAQDEPTLLVSLEMLPRKTLARMCRQATATDLPSAERRADFLRWSDGRLWLFDHVGALTPRRALALCRYFADEHKGAHVFIDSMMKVCESEESLDEQKKLVGDLCAIGQETGLHLHLVAHAKKPGAEGEGRPPTKYDIRGSSAISDQCHNIVTVWMNKAKRTEAEKVVELQNPDILAKPDHLVTIEKQRNGDFEGRFALHFDNRSMRFCDSDIAAVEPYPMEVA